MTLDALSNELLLQIAEFVDAQLTGRNHVMKFCLVSRRLRWIGQSVLYRTVQPSSARLHYLLRTLEDCPALADKIKQLIIIIDRGNTGCERAARDVDVWEPEDTASRILTLVRYVTRLDISVKNSQNNIAPLDIKLNPANLPNLHTLTIDATLLPLLAFELPAIKALRLREFTRDTLELQSTRAQLLKQSGIKQLNIEPTVHFADRDYTDAFDISSHSLEGLFTLLGCKKVTELRIDLWCDHSLDDNDNFSAQHLIFQLQHIAPLLDKLEISFKEGEGVNQTLGQFYKGRIDSFGNFSGLSSLTIPVYFLFEEDIDSSQCPLPEGLDDLTLIISSHEEIEHFVKELATRNVRFDVFRETSTLYGLHVRSPSIIEVWQVIKAVHDPNTSDKGISGEEEENFV